MSVKAGTWEYMFSIIFIDPGSLPWYFLSETIFISFSASVFLQMRRLLIFLLAYRQSFRKLLPLWEQEVKQSCWILAKLPNYLDLKFWKQNFSLLLCENHSYSQKHLSSQDMDVLPNVTLMDGSALSTMSVLIRHRRFVFEIFSEENINKQSLKEKNEKETMFTMP